MKRMFLTACTGLALGAVYLQPEAFADTVCLRVKNGKLIKKVVTTTTCPAKFVLVGTTTGATGPTGPIGSSGPTGATGPSGPLLTTLPSGATLTGFFRARATAQVGFELASSSISFQFPLAAAPTVELWETGAPATANCPGDDQNPQAAPGYLCVYAGLMTNVGSWDTTTPASGDGFSEPFGTGIYVRSAAAGDFGVAGSWAVTAP